MSNGRMRVRRPPSGLPGALLVSCYATAARADAVSGALSAALQPFALAFLASFPLAIYCGFRLSRAREGRAKWWILTVLFALPSLLMAYLVFVLV
jgi:ABC-type tungstate transport system substrate-binding protein